MAGNIKGITIEIDGNTTKLTDSLKKSDMAANNASKSIREIEKALKFNPGNTELVAQQQRNLQKQIDATKEKLSVLRNAEADIKRQFESGNLGAEKYEAFQREIITTESKLGSLEGKLKTSQSEQKRLSEATSGLTTIFQKSGKSVDDFADLIGQDVVEAFKKGEGTSAQMEEALKKVGEEMLGTGGDAEKLRSRLEELGKGVSLEDLKESAKDSGKWVDKLGDEAEQTGEQLNTIEKSAVSISGLDAAINLFGKLKDAALEAFNAIAEAWGKVDEGQDIIVAKTGATGAAADAMGESFNRVYSKIPADAQTVGNAIGEINTQFGLQGQALEDTSSLLIKYAQINGADVTNATQQARAAMDQFGLSGEQLGSVLDAVTAVGQSTGVSVDKLFDSVTKGAPVLDQMGLSFEESVSLMGQFEQSGIDGSKALSYLTKAQATAAKEGKTLKDALIDFSSVANSGASDTEKLNKASEFFGTKGGALMLKAAQDGKLNFDNLSKAASDTAGAVENTFNQMQDPADELTIASNNIDIALGSIGTNIQNALAPALERVVGWIQKASEWFANMDPNIQVAIVLITAIALAITGAIVVFGLLSAAFTAAAPIIAGITGAFTGVGAAISGLGAFIAANPIVLIIGAVVAAAALLIANWDTVKAAAKAVWAAVSAAWENLKQSIAGIVDGIKQSVSGAWEGIKTKTSEIWNGIKGFISGVWDGIKSGVSGAINDIKSTVDSVWNGIKNTTSNIWNGIKSTISGIVNGIKSAVSDAFNSVRSTITGIWDGIVSFIRNIHIPMPHFSISGSINPFSGNFPPHVGIDWYKEGGIFDRPSVIGVGEAGSEAVVPTHKLDAFFNAALKRVGGGEKTQDTVNVYISQATVREEADIPRIAEELQRLMERERRTRHV